MYNITNQTLELEIDSLDAMMTLATHVAKGLSTGDVICLSGDLGAGKTTFTQMLCKAIGITDLVTSPTFNIMNAYETGRLPLYHFDVYRISDDDEMYEIGFDDYLYGNGACIIEWATLVERLIPDDAVWMTLSLIGETSRRVVIEGPVEKVRRLEDEINGY